MLCQIFTNSDTVYLFVPYIHSHTNVAQIILGTRRITWRACIHVAMLHIYLFSHTPYVCLHLKSYGVFIYIEVTQEVNIDRIIELIKETPRLKYVNDNEILYFQEAYEKDHVLVGRLKKI